MTEKSANLLILESSFFIPKGNSNVSQLFLVALVKINPACFWMILNGLEGLLVKIAREKNCLFCLFTFSDNFWSKNCSKTYLPKNFQSMQMVFSQNLIVLDRGQCAISEKFDYGWRKFPRFAFKKIRKIFKVKFFIKNSNRKNDKWSKLQSVWSYEDL